MSNKALFKPLQIGPITLTHRIAMAPLTRLRASPTRAPTPLMQEYYTQRASFPGTLLISEGTIVSAVSCGGFPHAPGIWSEEQVAAWKEITDAVHEKESFIFCQLFAMGRAANAITALEEGIEVVAPSAIAKDDDEGTTVPRAMTVTEIKQAVEDFAIAARNAIRAGFDGVEVHGANGYLTDQFLQDVSNTRDDEYGGSVENRSRFLYEVLNAVVDAVGAERVGLRLSPWSRFAGMGMRDPIPQFSDIILKAKVLDLAYLHLVEGRIDGAEDADRPGGLNFAYKIWDRPVLVAGGYTPERARRLAEEEYPDKDIVVVFGRHFISNPDLVYRVREGLELAKYDRKTFYVNSDVGYVDYPFSAEYLSNVEARA
ncbi:hypothetical protein BJY04DRAFT_24639 [Aspergillus karnatakaensis]|uniref:alkene reductase n=1 Tax=Aspergillus karnatakaensis TaxID=1810916 RepID=UPI003CCE4715